MWVRGVFHPSFLQPEPTAPFFLLLSSVVQSWIFLSVFVPPLCVSAKYPPCVDVAGLGNEKLKLHVRRRRAPPLLFSFSLSLFFFFRRLLLANVDRKEEKRKR